MESRGEASKSCQASHSKAATHIAAASFSHPQQSPGTGCVCGHLDCHQEKECSRGAGTVLPVPLASPWAGHCAPHPYFALRAPSAFISPSPIGMLQLQPGKARCWEMEVNGPHHTKPSRLCLHATNLQTGFSSWSKLQAQVHAQENIRQSHQGLNQSDSTTRV